MKEEKEANIDIKMCISVCIYDINLQGERMILNVRTSLLFPVSLLVVLYEWTPSLLHLLPRHPL